MMAPRQHSSHWGTFQAESAQDGLRIIPFAQDPEPSAILANLPAALTHPARLARPLIRQGWLTDGPGPDPRRGGDAYVETDWDHALTLAAKELKRLGAGPESLAGGHVFGGSYGWASAGRFHHAQSQLHRFLNTAFGGYVGGVNTYSSAAGEVILQMVWGNPMKLTRDHPWAEELATDTTLLLAFGGLPLRNTAISPGGNSQHNLRGHLTQAAARGCRFVSISPLADDFAALPGVTWLAPRPGTDVALMLGMAWHLEQTGQVNRAYLDRYTVGYDRFLPYLLGADGVAKTPDWAASICEIPAEQIRALADLAAQSRTLINVTYSLQRAENGEQPVWMALTLAAMLGQGAQKGAGFSYGMGSIGNIGKQALGTAIPSLPQGQNKITDFIPVARISDLLLHPGKPYTYKGETRTYADIRLIYWAGGNPFHHHQDLSRLTQAFARPDTVIVQDSVGTSSAAHADIIFPATTTLEREDIGAAGNDPYLVAMQPVAHPHAEARDDFAIFAALAERLGVGGQFTEGLDTEGWLRRLYAQVERGLDVPSYDDFREGLILPLPLREGPGEIARFHLDPQSHPLATPSGRIEIWSDRVAGSGLPGHPAWLPPTEWLGAARAARHPFQLVANQPAGKLHSQLDFGATSMAAKRDGREVARLNPKDAAKLGIVDGDTLHIFNDRGGLLAVAAPSEAVRLGVVQLSTGAWYAPRMVPGLGVVCVNGNPNAVTLDIGASALSQGSVGQLALVSLARIENPPSVVPHESILPRVVNPQDESNYD